MHAEKRSRSPREQISDGGVDIGWDLSSIGDLAVAERVLTTNPAKKLYTPAAAKKGACPVMTSADVESAVSVVEFREKVILHLAIFSGLRPGEIMAIQRRNVAPDGSSLRSSSGSTVAISTLLRMGKLASWQFRRNRRRCLYLG